VCDRLDIGVKSTSQQIDRGSGGKWVKGQSGNPKGRPRTGMALAEYFRQHTDVAELHDLAISIARGEGVSLERDERGRAMPGPVSIPTARDRLAAMTFIRDTGFFKPAQLVGVGHVDPDDLGGGIDYDSLTTEQIDEAIAGYDRMAIAVGLPSIAPTDVDAYDDDGEPGEYDQSDIIDVDSEP
jgi:hypothetical protein